MKTIQEIRRARLTELVEREPSQAAFARKICKDKNQVNQWLGKGSVRNISHDLARMVEKTYRLPVGWLDQPEQSHGLRESGGSYTVDSKKDAENLRKAIKWLENQFIVLGVRFKAADSADLILEVFNAYKHSSKPNLIELSKSVATRLEKGSARGTRRKTKTKTAVKSKKAAKKIVTKRKAPAKAAKAVKKATKKRR